MPIICADGAAGAPASAAFHEFHGSNGGNGGELEIDLATRQGAVEARVAGQVTTYDTWEERLKCSARGGDGGRGGTGKKGLDGRDGISGLPGQSGQDGEDGMPGGCGGDGGDGGHGGRVRITVRACEAELVQSVDVDVAGGGGGEGGAGGAGGSGGSGGRGGPRRSDEGSRMTSDGRAGSNGRRGRPGSSGKPGTRGTVQYTLVDECGGQRTYSDVFLLKLVRGGATLAPQYRRGYLEPGGVYSIAGVAVENKAVMPVPKLTVPYEVSLACGDILKPLESTPCLHVPQVGGRGRASVPGNLWFQVARLPSPPKDNTVYSKELEFNIALGHPRFPQTQHSIRRDVLRSATVAYPVQMGVAVHGQFPGTDTHGAIVADVPFRVAVEVRNYGGQDMDHRRVRIRWSVRHTPASGAYCRAQAEAAAAAAAAQDAPAHYDPYHGDNGSAAGSSTMAAAAASASAPPAPSAPVLKSPASLPAADAFPQAGAGSGHTGGAAAAEGSSVASEPVPEDDGEVAVPDVGGASPPPPSPFPDALPEAAPSAPMPAPSAPSLPAPPIASLGVVVESTQHHGADRSELCDAAFNINAPYTYELPAFQREVPAHNGHDVQVADFSVTFGGDVPKYTPCQLCVELLLEDVQNVGVDPPVLLPVQTFVMDQGVSHTFPGFPSFYGKDECYLGQNYPEDDSVAAADPHPDVVTADVDDDFVDVTLLREDEVPPPTVPEHGTAYADDGTPPPFDVLLCVHRDTPLWVIQRMQALQDRAGLRTAVYDATLYDGLHFNARDTEIRGRIPDPTVALSPADLCGGPSPAMPAVGLSFRDYLRGKSVFVDNEHFTDRRIDITTNATIFTARAPAEVLVGTHAYAVSWEVGMYFFGGWAVVSAMPPKEAFALSGRQACGLRALAAGDLHIAFPSYPPPCDLRYGCAVEDDFVKYRTPGEEHMDDKVAVVLNALTENHPDLRYVVGVHHRIEQGAAGYIQNTWRLGDMRINVAPRNRMAQHDIAGDLKQNSFTDTDFLPVYFQMARLMSMAVKLTKLKGAKGYQRTLLTAAVTAELVQDLHFFFAKDTSKKYSAAVMGDKKVLRDWDLIARAHLPAPTLEAVTLRYEAVMAVMADAARGMFRGSRFTHLASVVAARLEALRRTVHVHNAEYANAMQHMRAQYAGMTPDAIVRGLVEPYASNRLRLIPDVNAPVKLRV